MKALMCRAFGPIDSLRVEDVPSPLPGPGKVLIDVKAAAINFPDALIVQGLYQSKPELPFSPGSELAGVVASVGEGVANVRAGDRVIALVGSGGFAEECLADAHQVLPLPHGMDFDLGAAFVLTYGTSLHALQRIAKLQAGETVLVLGAAGGVPSSAVQLCAAAGCRVIAVAGGAEKVDFCRKLGAEIAIDHTREDFVAAVKRVVGEHGIDVIVDFVQGEAGQRARPLLTVEGRHLLCGHAGGLIPIHPAEFYVQNWTLVGVCMGSGYGPKLMEIEQKAHDDLMELVRTGKYRATTSRVISFAEIPSALEDLANRHTFGRVVAKP